MPASLKMVFNVLVMKEAMAETTTAARQLLETLSFAHYDHANHVKTIFRDAGISLADDGPAV